MPDEALERICSAYGLGIPTSTLQRVTGGLLHKVWRLQTDRGIYALKVLNPEIMRRPSVLTRYVESERIAKSASEAGIPAAAALDSKDGPVFKVDGAFVMVYDWIDGTTLADQETTRLQASSIRSLLARIHQFRSDGRV